VERAWYRLSLTTHPAARTSEPKVSLSCSCREKKRHAAHHEEVREIPDGHAEMGRDTTLPVRDGRVSSSSRMTSESLVPFATNADSPFRIQINPTSPLHVHCPESASNSIIACTNRHDVKLTLFLFRHDPRLGELHDRAIRDLDVR
jgi:hypothetical protein